MYGFYQSITDFVLTANALLGATAFVALFGGAKAWIPMTATGIVTAASVCERGFKWSKTAKSHFELYRRFTELAAKIEAREPNPKNLKEVSAERVRIEKDELPIKRLVDIAARNEQLGADRNADYIIKMSWLQRKFGYIFTFGMPNLEKQRDAQAHKR
jgi:hypothetical protein